MGSGGYNEGGGNPGYTCLAAYEYNANNLLYKLAYANGHKVTYYYDEVDRPTMEKYSTINQNPPAGQPGEVDQYVYNTYNAQNQLAMVRDGVANQTTVYTYDAYGSQTDSRTYNTTDYHALTAANLRSSAKQLEDITANGITQTNRRETFMAGIGTQTTGVTTHAQGQVTGITANGATLQSYVYDSLGRVLRKNQAGSSDMQTTYTYAAGSQNLTKATDGINSTNNTGNRIAKIETPAGIFQYTYDQNGNITEIRNGSNALLYKYTYDNQNQLVREDANPGNGVTAYSKTFSYDGYGNLLSVQNYAYTTGAPGNLQSTKHYAYNNSNWKDQLTGYDGQAITYDAQGNPTTYFGREMVWQNGRQLKQITQNGQTIGYTYDANGIRQSKTAGGQTTTYYYEDGVLLGEVRTQGNTTTALSYFHDENDELIAMQYNGTVYYYIKNLQGDVVAIADKNGNILARYTYDAWGSCTVTDANGNPISDPNHIGNVNPIRYRGYYYDADTALYYLMSRYYDAEVGRFINADEPVILSESDSINLFEYCINNPVTYYDPCGHDAILLYSQGWNMGHISALVQDVNGNWYFFYWAVSAVYFWYVNPFSVQSLKNFNAWVKTKGGPGDYRGGVYMTGNTTKSYNHFNWLFKRYNNRWNKGWWVIGNVNYHYNIVTYNCTHATLEGLSKSFARLYIWRVLGGMFPAIAYTQVGTLFWNFSFTKPK